MILRIDSKPTFAVIAALSVVLAGTTATRAQPAARQAQKARPATAPAVSADLEDTILPEVNFQNVSLDDMVAYLQEVVPHYKAVVFRDPDLASDQPTINIRLKGVSLGQLMQLLANSYPNLEFQAITGAGGTIQLIKVHPPQGMVPSGGAVVKVYALGDVVDRLAARRPEVGKDAAGARKAALNDVLSLIKVALSQGSEGNAAPTLQIHEETQTLIFKGSPAQQNVVEEALTTLRPRWNESAEAAKVQAAQAQAEFKAAIAQDDERIAELQKRLAQTTDALREREDMNSKQTIELERLKVRLEEMMKIQEREAAERAREQRQPVGK